MAFPFTVSGTVTVPIEPGEREFVDRVARDIAAGLETAKAKRVRRETARVTFRGGIFRPISSYNPTFAVSSGTVEIAAGENHAKISYRLRTSEFMIVASIGVVVVIGIPVSDYPDLTPVEVAGILAGVWLFIIGANDLSIRLRFRKWLKRIAGGVKAPGGES